MTQMTDNMRAAFLMIGGMTFFALGDAIVKTTAGILPLSQMLVLRGILATAFLLGLARWMGQLSFRLPTRDWILIAIRSACEAAAAWFFLTALYHMPIANLTAILQMLPLTMTLSMALFFGEKVGWRRWAAILVGFIGMLLIVRPGPDGFTLYAMYGLATVGCVTLRDLATRHISSRAPSLTVTFFGSLSVTLFGVGLSFVEEWATFDWGWGVTVLGAAGTIILAYSLSVLTMRVGEVSFTAPFRYSGLVVALILGLVMFGDWPDPLTLLGAAIVVGSGLFTMWRERVTARAS